MTTSRQRILAHLEKNRSASAREVARALNLAQPNVRYHLSVLCSEGRAEMAAVNNRNGRGRPEKVYSLSQAALGDNLAVLTKALLTEAGSGLKMEALAKSVLDGSQFSGLSLTRRLALLVEELNKMHYLAKWEAGAGGPRVIFGRCPYARVIDGHPELCKMDAALLEGALERLVTQSKKNEPTLKGLCPFWFQIG